MKFTMTQKATCLDNKKIAYVEAVVTVDGNDFKVLFDEHTKKRFNNFARDKGFVVGTVSDEQYNELVNTSPSHAVIFTEGV